MILRSRPSSNLWHAAAVAVCLCFAGSGIAQEATPVLTIDQDRLVSETQLGAETLAALEQRAQELAAENESIEAALIAEEQDLTEKRQTLDADEFRELANAFDTRVQQLRAEQDEKVRQLNRAREETRTQFLRDAAPIISEIVRTRGALVVIDRRDVFLSADSIDITEEAIRRINEAREN